MALVSFVAEIYEVGCEDVAFHEADWMGSGPHGREVLPRATRWIPPAWFLDLHRLWWPLVPHPKWISMPALRSGGH
eukprot:5375226-Amphidinium_carterae.1